LAAGETEARAFEKIYKMSRVLISAMQQEYELDADAVKRLLSTCKCNEKDLERLAHLFNEINDSQLTQPQTDDIKKRTIEVQNRINYQIEAM
jgi:hypothetical protein